MDKNALTVFKADMQAQIALVDRILTLIDENFLNRIRGL